LKGTVFANFDLVLARFAGCKSSGMSKVRTKKAITAKYEPKKQLLRSLR